MVGVAGSMPVHGVGAALFLVKIGDKDAILRIFNCLLCHGEDSFHLLSVSQMLRTKLTSVTFSMHRHRASHTHHNDDTRS